MERKGKTTGKEKETEITTGGTLELKTGEYINITMDIIAIISPIIRGEIMSDFFNFNIWFFNINFIGMRRYLNLSQKKVFGKKQGFSKKQVLC